MYTVYVDFIGGAWEAFFYGSNGTRRVSHIDRDVAINKLARMIGVKRSALKVVNIASS